MRFRTAPPPADEVDLAGYPEIKEAPGFDPDTYTDPMYRDKVGSYCGGTYPPQGSPRPAAGLLSGTLRPNQNDGRYGRCRTGRRGVRCQPL